MTFKTLVSTLGSKSCYLKPLDKELLLCHILKCRRENLITKWDTTVPLKVVNLYKQLYFLRMQGVPLAYLLERKEFYNDTFYVTPDVLIPRPETETLVSAVLKVIKNSSLKNKKINIIDFGCGSGCIGLSLLKHLPKSYLIAVDKSIKALFVAQKNAKNLALLNRVTFINKDISLLKKSHLPLKLKNNIPIIVANPPYVSLNDKHLEWQVYQFEPLEALLSPQKGLWHIHCWLQKACELLKTEGFYFFELGKGQYTQIKALFSKKFYQYETFKDLLGITRVVCMKKTKTH